MHRNMGWKNMLFKRAVQVFFFGVVFFIVFSHYLGRQGIDIGWPSHVSLHALCPFGAVETAGRLVLEGRFIPKIHESNLWLFAGVALTTLLIGPVFCGYLCPLGSVQEWVGRLGKRVLGKRFNGFAGQRLDRILGYLRYGMLVLIIVQTTRAISLVFSRFDPYYALFHFWMGDVFLTALLVLATVLLLSLFVERPWCRWFCPFGALLGVLQMFSPWKISRHGDACISCTLCTKACPMGIAVHRLSRIRNTRCNRCGSCVDACPREGALHLSLPRNGRLPLRRWVTVLVLVSVMGATVLGAQSAGLFRTSNRAVIARGKLSIQEIEGMMSLGEIASGLGMEVTQVRGLLNLPSGVPGSTRLIDLEDIDETLTVNTIKDLLSDRVATN